VRGGNNLNRHPTIAEVFRVAQTVHVVRQVAQEARVDVELRFFEADYRRLRKERQCQECYSDKRPIGVDLHKWDFVVCFIEADG
jgi:hypothetical protein